MDKTRAGERMRLIIDQIAEELGHRAGWKTEAASRMGIGQTVVSHLLSGRRPNSSLETVEKVVRQMGIDRNFFFVSDLGDRPHFKQWIYQPAQEPGENQYWRRFVSSGMPQTWGLTPEQIEWLRVAPFRGGVQSVDDYMRVAESILRKDQPQAGGYAASVERTKGKSIKVGKR